MDHDKTKDKNRFDVVDTPVYNQIKEVQAQTNDVSQHTYILIWKCY